MAKINIPFNGVDYLIDESALTSTTTDLQSHLSTSMSGTGATINFDGNIYNVDSTKLATERNKFVSHLETIAGTDSKVTVGGVEYGIDSSKTSASVVELETAFDLLSKYEPPVVMRAAGLYETGTDTMTKSWQDLLTSGKLKVSQGVLTSNSATTVLVGDLVLPNDGSVTSLGKSVFDRCKSLTSVVMSENITSIGNFAFYECSKLTSVEIPNSVTSIGISAFYGCTSLTFAKMSNSVTSLGTSVFNNCTALTSVEIPNGITLISEDMFKNCTALTSIEIPNSVTSIDNSAFYGCSNLTSIVIPDSVTTIGSAAFRDCSSLTSIVIPDSVITMGSSVFANCSGLTSITIGGSVSSIGEQGFYNCLMLENISVDQNNAYYQSIDGNLYDKNSTTLIQYAINKTQNSFTIPDGITTISNYAFRSCSSLTSITIPNSVVTINYCAFMDCISLQDVYYNGTQAQWLNILIDSNNDSLINATIHWEEDPGDEPVVTRAAGLYETGTDIMTASWDQLLADKVIKVNDGAVGIGGNVLPDSLPEKNEYGFYYGVLYTSAYGGYVFYADGSFDNCYNDVESSHYPAGSVRYGNNNIYIVDWDWRLYVVDDGKAIDDYNGCYYAIGRPQHIVGDLVLPEDGTINSIQPGAFPAQTSLTKIVIPNSVTSIGDSAFNGCSGLTEIIIPNSVTSISDYAFYNCSNLTSITISNGITSISDYVFDGCNSLTSITIPDGVVSIGSYAFEDCSNLKNIIIPDSVTLIGNFAFMMCNALTNVYYKGTATQWKSISIGSSGNNSLTKATKYYDYQG